MKTVVVGAAGGVGTRLCDALGLGTVRVDRVPTGAEGIVADLVDWADASRLAEAVREQVAAVYLAARLDVDPTGEETGKLVADNVVAPANFVSALAPRLEHVVYLSSVSVYGTPRRLPISESDDTRPTSLYGASKLGAEAVLTAACTRADIPLTIIRATQLFAVPSAATTLPHRLVDALRAGRVLELDAEPTTVRDYLHVDDLVELLEAALTVRQPGTFNAGSGSGTTLRELVAAALAAAGSRLQPEEVFRPGAVVAPSQLLDITRARRAFGFEPSRPISSWFEAELRDVT